MTCRDLVQRSPLVPAALAATAGILADRWLELPLGVFAAVALAGLLLSVLLRRSSCWSNVGVQIVVFGLGGLHHHLYLHAYPSDDIGNFISEEPTLARLIGRLADEPAIDPAPPSDPLRNKPAVSRTRGILDVIALETNEGRQACSGRVALSASGDYSRFRAGDAVEAVGWLSLPESANNPGERDSRAEFLKERVRGLFLVRGEGGSIRASPQDDVPSITRTLSWMRGWARHQLSAQFAPPMDGIAAALLLGDNSAMSRSDWQKFIHTGVVHVISVSGQHLAVLAGFGWLVLKCLGVSRRRSAACIAIGIIIYAAIAGGRPPVVRSAVMVVAVCGAMILRRSNNVANTFALAWLLVLVLNPTDITDAGCLFSFVCVAVLIWGCARWFARPPIDPIQQMVEASRPPAERRIRWCARHIAIAYAITFVMGLVVLPITAARYHLVSPAGFVIGPPAILLASMALIFGFLQLLMSAIAPVAIAPMAALTRGTLSMLAWLVDTADRFPGGHLYVGTVPIWWIAGFYLLVAIAIWIPSPSIRPRRVLVAMTAWCCIGLACAFHRPKPDGLVMTFLAVGHGGCTVIEAPDGRVIVYDAGSMSGPDVTRRIIAPYLWERGIRAIDEVFLSHADLDHFNGLPALLQRFPVGRVSLTPSFTEKPSPGVVEMMSALHGASLPTRIVTAGDRMSCGEVGFDVLHPPLVGPPGPENNRSMVLMIHYQGTTVLLTGDLDAEGRTQLLSGPRRITDVLMAPHHGGKSANPPSLVDWCRPDLVIACQGANDRTGGVQQMYETMGCRYIGTWPHGATTLTIGRHGFDCETFRDRRRWPMRGLEYSTRTGAIR